MGTLIPIIIVTPFERGRISIAFIPYFPRFAIAIGTEGVVIEGEGFAMEARWMKGAVCTEVYVGFGSGVHKGKGMCRW